jgi:glycerol-3-phosphate acyltransferase PlsX
MSILPVAVDAMGGDNAPKEIVAGAEAASSEWNIPVVLVGKKEEIGDTKLEIVEASEVIEMTDEPGSAVRNKKDSSLVIAAELVRDGKASAMVSAGNTGATMASALLRMGRISKVARPAVATILPVFDSTPTVLLDAGANAECSPQWLVQFAQMGSVFAQQRFGIETPRVGLLSIGEESSKGNPLVKEAHNLLSVAPNIKFSGNVEGRDLLTDQIDVVVTDGFTGNVVLKTLEGSAKTLVGAIMNAMVSTAEAKEAAKTLLPVLTPIADVIDPETYGGAMLLGVDGVCIISHGSSSSRAIKNAVSMASEMVEHDLVGKLRENVSSAE